MKSSGSNRKNGGNASDTKGKEEKEVDKKAVVVVFKNGLKKKFRDIDNYTIKHDAHILRLERGNINVGLIPEDEIIFVGTAECWEAADDC